VPDASIITRIATQVGGSFGSAVLAVVLTGAVGAATSTGAVAAYQHAFWWAIGFTAAGLLIALALPGQLPTATTAPASTNGPDRVPVDDEQPEQQAEPEQQGDKVATLPPA
jgi:hypothetical protein